MESLASLIPTKPVPTPTQRSPALDDLIMGTNSSSIVSKRSVERFYYPDEPHYFRYFVKKFQRRAPLINRGYWLRLRAIDVTVKQFLLRSAGRKVVINLGCGSDVLPWQCHARYGDSCNNALFIDVDYPDLMHKKRSIVLETPQLKGLLGSSFKVFDSDQDLVLLKSEKYCQIGCDLRELEALRRVLETLVDLSDCLVLFVAEVSITYMDTESADSLLEWASSVGKAEFCLLEQLLPYGRGHPFAQTMLRHFDKLKTPLRSVGHYPTVSDQFKRFKSRGWSSVQIWDLWDAWCCGEFVSAEERVALDDIEPFDEWEEFMLFARHYFVLHASATETSEAMNETADLQPTDTRLSTELTMNLTTITGSSKRRFGAFATLKDVEGRNFGLNMMGLGSNSREDSSDIYSLDGRATSSPTLPLTGPSPRMCFTITDLGCHGILLIGGRGSPASAFSDCWLLRNGHDPSWQSTWKLPAPLYRHSALRLPGTSLVFVAGGKSGPSQISGSYFVLNPEQGWLQCKVTGEVPRPSFGSVLCNNPPTLSFTKLKNDVGPELSIFGAQVIDINGNTIICGGMAEDQTVDGQAMYCLTSSNSNFTVVKIKQCPDNSAAKPFMIGSSALYHDGRIIIAGGGATCFSMGTFWETNIYQAQLPAILHSGRPPPDEAPKPRKKRDSEDGRLDAKASISTIARLSLNSASQFEGLLQRGEPVVIENLYLGDCLANWNSEYMTDKVGSDKKVVVHECQPDNGKMDFNAKNFQYVTSDFGTIMARAKNGDRLYLRSLSNDKPTEQPAKLEEDFPDLATEFVLPEQLSYVKKQLFSSVLRVSGRVNMWLHYDVMANVYAQVVGSKRMIIFPPSDVPYLAFAPGASSSSVDVFALLETPKLARTQPYEAIVGPGDVLFLPPLWLHTATPMTNMSVAVNTFFRDLDLGYATGRDVYGNRDLAAYERGRQDVAKIAKQFQKLPKETRRFYLARLADELLQAGEGN
ncbi:leucine carboxyl methyltransferase [Cordyceps militaris CM01]|uniref:tRNA wybutosine-synthesizing protein 4 n=1 Tax=Cordyceps militaris (strain CM01) TaxID=983644 RepID=G3JPT7_CORMM|nr:leucine carboxyl methyltransferase [Cordyceps militaris CM01]EGX89188.1 leucine carboxyl methyltransferase [Cordyceps militaris CM01]